MKLIVKQYSKRVKTDLTFILMSISFERKMCEAQYNMRLYLYTRDGVKEFNWNVNLTIVKKTSCSEISHNFFSSEILFNRFL